MPQDKKLNHTFSKYLICFCVFLAENSHAFLSPSLFLTVTMEPPAAHQRNLMVSGNYQ